MSAPSAGAEFDPLDLRLAEPAGRTCERYWPFVLSLQEACPVSYSSAQGGFWTVNGFDNVSEAARDWETFTTTLGAEAVPLGTGDTGFRLLPVEYDPPEHRELRRLLNPPFRATEVARHAEAMERIASDLIDRFESRGSCEFVSEFAMPYPGQVFFQCFLGLAPERSEPVRRMVESMLTDPTNATGPITQFPPWCAEVIAERRAAGPRGDLLDAIVRGSDEGLLDDGAQFAAMLTIIGAGIETTAMAVANIAMLLAGDEDLRARLRDADMTRACEEFLRFHAPVPAMGRTATRDVKVGDQLIREGERVVLNFGAANRDPRVWRDADDIDVGRADAGKHLTFGAGPHRCLGAHLAMLELETALRCLLERLPDLRLDPADQISWRTALSRGPSRLRLLFGSSAA